MNLNLGPAFTRAQAVVNGRVSAIPRIIVALVVFGAFLLVAAIVKGVVARLTETRLHAHRNVGVAVGGFGQGVVIFLGLLVALSVACRRSGLATRCRSLASGEYGALRESFLSPRLMCG